MKKQRLFGIDEQKLQKEARYLIICFPFNEELCTYTSPWEGELYQNKYPLVSKGKWFGVVDLTSHQLLNWKPSYGDLYLQANVRDSGTYFLQDKSKKVLCKLAGYVPNGLIPNPNDCGDYIRLNIQGDGLIENWPVQPNFFEFVENAIEVGQIDMGIQEEPIFSTTVEFTYHQLMSHLLQLPKHLQLEIGKALLENASEGMEEDDFEEE